MKSRVDNTVEDCPNLKSGSIFETLKIDAAVHDHETSKRISMPIHLGSLI